MIHPILFYSLSALIVTGAAGVVLTRNPVYAVLSLVITLFGLSALFVALQAYFVAVVQVLVYAGAVMVLFLFVVMLLELAPETLQRARSRTLGLAGTVVSGLFLMKTLQVTSSIQAAGPGKGQAGLVGTTAAVGEILFTRYTLPFEVASLLLLAGILGAIVLAKKKL